jgi:hypothetical protein
VKKYFSGIHTPSHWMKLTISRTDMHKPINNKCWWQGSHDIMHISLMTASWTFNRTILPVFVLCKFQVIICEALSFILHKLKQKLKTLFAFTISISWRKVMHLFEFISSFYMLLILTQSRTNVAHYCRAYALSPRCEVTFIVPHLYPPQTNSRHEVIDSS